MFPPPLPHAPDAVRAASASRQSEQIGWPREHTPNSPAPSPGRSADPSHDRPRSPAVFERAHARSHERLIGQLRAHDESGRHDRARLRSSRAVDGGLQRSAPLGRPTRRSEGRKGGLAWVSPAAQGSTCTTFPPLGWTREVIHPRGGAHDEEGRGGTHDQDGGRRSAAADAVAARDCSGQRAHGPYPAAPATSASACFSACLDHGLVGQAEFAQDVGPVVQRPDADGVRRPGHRSDRPAVGHRGRQGLRMYSTVTWLPSWALPKSARTASTTRCLGWLSTYGKHDRRAHPVQRPSGTKPPGRCVSAPGTRTRTPDASARAAGCAAPPPSGSGRRPRRGRGSWDRW